MKNIKTYTSVEYNEIGVISESRIDMCIWSTYQHIHQGRVTWTPKLRTVHQHLFMLEGKYIDY